MDPNQYDYTLPKELVALEPASPRDSSKLLVYNTLTDTITIDKFFNLDKYLPSDTFMVLNKTKVIPSRIVLHKENGGKVKVLFLVNELKDTVVKAMLDRKVEIGQTLHFDEKYRFKVIGQNEHIFFLSLEFETGLFIELLEKKGSMPIPPYLKHSPLKDSDLKTKYQTIFAEEKGSAAAPTASLHFTYRVFNKLEQKHIDKLFVKLHVGAGTFAPLTDKQIQEDTLHAEWFDVPDKTAEAIKRYKAEDKRLLAVGTTVVRTLESASTAEGVVSQRGETTIFIHPPYHFKAVDMLLTNFHVPKSSLMMLVDAFLKDKQSKKSIMQLYEKAIQEKFRFFSFGDAMLII